MGHLITCQVKGGHCLDAELRIVSAGAMSALDLVERSL